MIEIAVPGGTDFRFEHLILDFNGTLARDGDLLADVATQLNELARRVCVHVLTADTFGQAREALSDVDCKVLIIGRSDQAEAKRAYVEKLSPAHTIAIGNGRNDCLMMKEATLGIAVIGPEGAAVETLIAAQIAAPAIGSALDLLLQPLRLVATLRS